MRIAFAVVMLVHGLAHLVGFLAPQKASTILFHRIDIGRSWFKVLSATWLVVALAFALTSLAVIMSFGAWPSLALAMLIISVVLCVLQLPETKIGLVLDGALLAWLIVLTNG
jgi:hypothetical protein